MNIKLLDHTLNPVETIGRMASVCYDSVITTEACIKRATHCKDRGHLATMRFAYATFNVSGISRVCSHQLVRIAHAGILQRSQRYVKESDIQFVHPEIPEEIKAFWLQIEHSAKELYNHLVDNRLMKKEDARYILPQGCTTELNLCLNFQAWQDVLRNRTAKAAQWEVRDVANEIQRQLHKIAPELFAQ